MIRSERLFLLERMLRGQKVTSLDDLCEQFGVSARTMYRDIRALSNVDVPVYFEDGYRLESTKTESANALTDDEQLLLLFCLQNNPVSGYRVMRQRMDRIAKKLIGFELLTARDRSASFSLYGHLETIENENDKNLRVFLRSISRKVNVRIRLKNHDLEERVYQPRSVKLSKNGPKYLVLGLKSNHEKTLSFESVETVTELEAEKRRVRQSAQPVF